MRKNNILSFFATQIRNFESKAEEILTPCFRLENQIKKNLYIIIAFYFCDTLYTKHLLT